MHDRIAVLLLFACAGLSGCATHPDGSRWGEHADFTPGWKRVGDAAVAAVTSPAVWIPLGGAAAMQIDHWDRHMSDWAIEHTPIFGDAKSAGDSSDMLQLVAGVGYVASVLATPGGDAGADWFLAKGGGALVGLSAIAATELTSEGFKAAVGRERPNGDNNASFPSAHASFAAVTDRLTSRNLDAIPMNDALRTTMQVGTEVLTIATGWARVEAGEHYPSDVLFGMGLGNFFGIMFDEAFMGGEQSPNVTVSFAPARGGGEITWGVRF